MKLKLVVPVFLVGLFAVGLAYAVAQRRDGIEQDATDVLVTNDVERELKRYLNGLESDSPIFQRYGKFVALKGAGHQRGTGFKIGGYLSITRIAVFEKAEVRCPLRIYARGPLSVRPRMMPTKEWMDKNPHASVEKSGNEFVVKAPGMTTATSLEISATHPKFFSSTFDRRRAEQMEESVDKATAILEKGVTQEQPQQQNSAREWFQSQKQTAPVDMFLSKAFEHQDLKVQMEAAKLLSLPSPGYGKVSHADSTIALLLDVIADSEQDDVLRKTIVSALMLNYENQRKLLYTRLREMGNDAHIFIPVLASSLNAKKARHMSKGGAFDAPIGAVELLGEWGPAAKDAVPALATTVETHPNQWDMAPAAAKALGEIGPAAEAAIGALIRASGSSRANVRAAATAALEKVHTGGELPKNYDVSAEGPIEKLGFNFMPKPRHTFWLGETGDRIWSIVNDKTTSGLWEIDFEDRVYRQSVAFNLDGLVDVYPTGNTINLLRVTKSEIGYQVIVDRWSRESRSLVTSIELADIPKLSDGQRLNLRNIVWDEDAKTIAFVQITSKPVDGKPNAWRESRRLHLFDLATNRSLINKKVKEYLMDPIAFGDATSELYFYGYCFSNKKHCIASMDLKSNDFTPIEDTELSGYAAIDVEGHLAVYQVRGSSKIPLKLLNLRTSKVIALGTTDDAARQNRPWNIAFKFLGNQKQIAVVTDSSIDIFETESGNVIWQVNIFSPNGGPRTLPIMIDATGDTLVLLASSTGGATSKTGLWVRREKIGKTPINDSPNAQRRR